MVASTLREATSGVAATFRDHTGTSPFHLPHTNQLRPSIRRLFTALDNTDPPKKRQKAVTPKFLRALYRQSGASNPKLSDSIMAHTADITIGAWFFAMRACEFTHQTQQRKTKPIRSRDIVFRDKHRRTISHDSSALSSAMFVTITFQDQKNGLKRDARTQQNTGDPILCPVRRWAAAVRRLRRMGFSTRHEIFYYLSSKLEHTVISSSFLKDFLRNLCRSHGGHQTFGFKPHEIGTRSIRSGAAMALFLANTSTARIMILGRWSSDAFLDYIRPQVLEWTSNMSSQMAKSHTFTDLNDVALTDPRTRTPKSTFNGPTSSFFVPKFNIHD